MPVNSPQLSPQGGSEHPPDLGAPSLDGLGLLVRVHVLVAIDVAQRRDEHRERGGDRHRDHTAAGDGQNMAPIKFLS